MTTTWKVLIVDDNEFDLKTYQRYLADNCTIHTAQNYDEIIKLLSENDYDCIVLDYNLGEYDGLELVQIIRNNYHIDPPIILLTGQGNEEIAASAFSMGISDYIMKTRVNANSLYRAIRNAIIQFELEKEIQNKNIMLKQMNTDLQSANQNIQQMHHVLSHELKTPLTALIEFVKLLLSGDFGAISETQLEILKMCDDSCTLMHQYINDLTDLSMVESSKLVLNKQETDIALLVSETLQLVKKAANNRHIELVAEVTNQLQPIKLDRNRILQSLINLINNAIKFSPENSRIIVGAQLVGKECHLSVTDSGLGIPKDQIDKIFDPYYQVTTDGTRKSGAQGLGLGLRICYGILEAHGGKITVTSEINRGSTFKMQIPIT
jgi:signal transduction histidine kinase